MPGTPTTPDNLRFPVDTDTPDVPRDVKWLADDTQAALLKRDQKLLQGVPIFENAADRDGQFAAAGITPSEGMLVYMKDSNLLLLHDGTTWGTLSMVKYSGRSITTNPGTITPGAMEPLEGWTAEPQPGLPAGWTAMSVGNTGITAPATGVYSVHCAFAVAMNTSGGTWGIIIEPIVDGARPDYIRGSIEYAPPTLPAGIGLMEASGHWTLYLSAGNVVASQALVTHPVTTFYNAVIQLVGPV